jgi:hypothetical protein
MHRTVPSLLAALLLASAPAAAEPTVQVGGGSTAVALSDDFVDALGALAVDAAVVSPARLRRGVVAFPIPAGALDLGTSRGDVFHEGGLALVAGGTEVKLLNFVIDTQSTPVLTGLVAVNGDLIGRVPLFELGLTQAPELYKKRFLVLRGVDVTLTGAAADALNGAFGVSAFAAGFPVGEARLLTRVIDMPKRDDDDDDDDDDREGDDD